MAYDTSPSQSDVPIAPPEVDEWLADPKAFRDPAAIVHMLGRLQVTLRHHQTRMTQIARDLQSLQQSAAGTGRATTLSPLDALRYLSEEQRTQVFSDAQRAHLEQARRARDEAEAYRTRIVEFIEKANGFAAQVDTHPGIPDDAKAYVRGLVATLLGGSQ